MLRLGMQWRGLRNSMAAAWPHAVSMRSKRGVSQHWVCSLHRPLPVHAHTQLLTTWSKDMAASADAMVFQPAPSTRAVRRMSAAL